MTQNQYKYLVSGVKNLENLETLGLEIDSAIYEIEDFFKELAEICKIKQLKFKIRGLDSNCVRFVLNELLAFSKISDLTGINLEFINCGMTTQLYNLLMVAIACQVNLKSLRINSASDSSDYFVLWTDLKAFEKLAYLQELDIPINKNLMNLENSNSLFQMIYNMKSLQKLGLFQHMKIEEKFDKNDFFQNLAVFLSKEDQPLTELKLSKFEISWTEIILLSDGLKNSKNITKLNLDFYSTIETLYSLKHALKMMTLSTLRMIIPESSIIDSLILLEEIVDSLSHSLKRFELLIVRGSYRLSKVEELKVIKFARELQKKFPKIDLLFDEKYQDKIKPYDFY